MAGIAAILGCDSVINGKGECVKIEDICKDKTAIGKSLYHAFSYLFIRVYYSCYVLRDAC